MKRWFWGEDFCLRTARDPVAVRALLRRHTLTGEWDDREKTEPYWTGDLPFTGEAFWFSVLCFGRNSWQPEWRCTLTGGRTGTRLEVRARCRWFTRMFMCVWIGLLALLTLRLAHSGAGWAVTLPFWAFGLGLGSLGFWVPERRARGRLCRLLEGTLE